MAEPLIAIASRPPHRGRAGVTHCGSWTPVTPSHEYGYRTRVVCARGPGHARAHRSRDGLSWSRSNPTPARRTGRPTLDAIADTTREAMR